jgi:hypothetical protein
LLEMAEAKARQKFPDYKGFDFEIDDKGNAIASAEELDEVEEYKAYAMYEIEEAGEANVAEYVEIDTNFEFGIGLEAYLNLPEITEATIIQFIEDFKLLPIKYKILQKSRILYVGKMLILKTTEQTQSPGRSISDLVSVLLKND